MGILIILFIVITIITLSISDFSILESISVSFFSVYLINFIKKLGNSVWLVLDLIVIIACITWLIIPLLFYHYFDNDDLTYLWAKGMPINSEEYYSFILPATLSLALGLHWPFGVKNQFNYSLEHLRKAGFLNRPNILAYQLIAISLVASILRPLVSSDLTYVFYLCEKLFLLGLLYLFFSGHRPKIYILIIGVIILIGTSIRSGMFGELVYMLVIASIILMLGKKYSFKNKFGIIIVGFLAIIILQSIKADYRKVAWNTGANAAYFGELILDRVTNPSSLLNKETLFGISVRFNQGWLIAGTMAYVPSVAPFANGQTIWQSVVSIIVPRFLWPEKLNAGGKANLERFLGIKDISYSMNLGPAGEGYANFGIFGGIIFMLFYGLFFHWIFNNLVRIATLQPTILLWIPLIFFYAISVETDMVTTLNSLVKTIVFVYLLWKLYPLVFKLKL